MASQSTLGYPTAIPILHIKSAALFGVALTVSFAFFSIDGSPSVILGCLGAVAGVLLLLFYPEFALALYVVVGDIKGDDRIASLIPVDLTLALGAILLAGILLNLLRKKRVLRLPPVYFLFLALVAIMGASLSYTPVLESGADKLARFLTVTGIVIIGPFFVLGTPQAMKRFLIAFSVAAMGICAYSLTSLGGAERLATPSDNTIGLGHVACALFIVLWFGVMPRFSFSRRIWMYPLLAVPALAMIGSGSRGPVIALGVAVLAGLYYYRRLLLDLGCLCALGIFVIPFAGIPQASLEYLGTLLHCGNVSQILSFRGDLLSFGWSLLRQHPLIGAGLGGYRYDSPNPGLYNWPHNIFLEIACELGLPALLIALVIFGAAMRDAIRQVRETVSPYFSFSLIAAALLLTGIINSTNTGDINSDRLTWLFVALIFVVQGIRKVSREEARFEYAQAQAPATAFASVERHPQTS